MSTSATSHPVNSTDEQYLQDAKGLIWAFERLDLQPGETEELKEQTNKSNRIMKMCVGTWCRCVNHNHKRLELNKIKRRLEQIQARRFVVDTRRANGQQRQQVHQACTYDLFGRLAFEYEQDIQYYAHSNVGIGAMHKECQHCNALKFKNEPAGLCCVSGKVQLPEIETPSAPMNRLLIGTDSDTNLFMKSNRIFNSCFQMTSFGATETVKNNASKGQQFNSTFKIKSQVYHKVGSLLPIANEPPKVLQIYFRGGGEERDSKSVLANRMDAGGSYNNLSLLFARRMLPN
ncbi:uncharacterized protein TNCV_174561 [Trichonephila clavipes]|nr:uncharacterized protein TNCV_174561 [Trichonephila clavipes]